MEGLGPAELAGPPVLVLRGQRLGQGSRAGQGEGEGVLGHRRVVEVAPRGEGDGVGEARGEDGIGTRGEGLDPAQARHVAGHVAQRVQVAAAAPAPQDHRLRIAVLGRHGRALAEEDDLVALGDQWGGIEEGGVGEQDLHTRIIRDRPVIRTRP